MQNERYSRQILFSPIGTEGQRKLSQSRVLVVGAGALGAANAETLVRAGVGTVTIVDRDYVEFSNLQRQQLYTEEDARQRLPKAVAAKRRLEAVNPDVRVEAHVMDASVFELEQLVPDADLIIDATDNFDTRLILNDLSQKYGIPWIYGACVASYGLSYMIIPGETPCLQCLLPGVPVSGATCDTAGILAPAVQMTAAHQSAEALKWLTGNRRALRNRLVSFDLWANQHASIQVDGMKRDDCPSCGTGATYPYLSPENLTRTAVLCGRDTVQIRPPQRMERDLEALAGMLKALGEGTVEANPFLLSYSVEPFRLVFFKDGRVLVHGTKDIAEAKSLYYRYLG